MCPTNDGIEDMGHFLLLCHSFDVQRRHLLTGVSVLLRQFVEMNSLPNDVLVQRVQILLYGDKNLSNEINKSILELTLVFIHNAGRFRKVCYSTQQLSPFLLFFLFTCLRLFHIG